MQETHQVSDGQGNLRVLDVYRCQIDGCGKLFQSRGALFTHLGWHKRRPVAKKGFADRFSGTRPLVPVGPGQKIEIPRKRFRKEESAVAVVLQATAEKAQQQLHEQTEQNNKALLEKLEWERQQNPEPQLKTQMLGEQSAQTKEEELLKELHGQVWLKETQYPPPVATIDVTQQHPPPQQKSKTTLSGGLSATVVASPLSGGSSVSGGPASRIHFVYDMVQAFIYFVSTNWSDVGSFFADKLDSLTHMMRDIKRSQVRIPICSAACVAFGFHLLVFPFVGCKGCLPTSMD